MKHKPVKIALEEYHRAKAERTQQPRESVASTCRKYNVSRPYMQDWQKEAPESVAHLYDRLKEAEISVNDEFFGVIPGSAYSLAVAFLIKFCRDEQCELSDIVKRVKPIKTK